MSDLAQRREPIRSKALRRAAADQRCTLNLPGICNYDASTVVLAHIRDETFGRGQKADDTSGMHCCHACHTAFDLHRTGLDEAALLRLVLRAYQRTVRRLVQMDVMHVELDVPLIGKPRAREPQADRKKVAAGRPLESHSNWPVGRKLVSGNSLRAKPRP